VVVDASGAAVAGSDVVVVVVTVTH